MFEFFLGFAIWMMGTQDESPPDENLSDTEIDLSDLDEQYIYLDESYDPDEIKQNRYKVVGENEQFLEVKRV